jgi:hypothetical protein
VEVTEKQNGCWLPFFFREREKVTSEFFFFFLRND